MGGGGMFRLEGNSAKGSSGKSTNDCSEIFSIILYRFLLKQHVSFNSFHGEPL
jgi:hypothetical protein